MARSLCPAGQCGVSNVSSQVEGNSGYWSWTRCRSLQVSGHPNNGRVDHHIIQCFFFREKNLSSCCVLRGNIVLSTTHVAASWDNILKIDSCLLRLKCCNMGVHNTRGDTYQLTTQHCRTTNCNKMSPYGNFLIVIGTLLLASLVCIWMWLKYTYSIFSYIFYHLSFIAFFR